MKTLIRNPEGASTFIFADDISVVVSNTEIKVGNPVQLIISDMNNQNSVLYEGVTPPEDWTGWKYLFDGTTWTPNPDWVEPTPIEIAP